MLRTTLLAACLLAALQSTNVAGVTLGRDNYVELTINGGRAEEPQNKSYPLKKGQHELKILHQDLPPCELGRKVLSVDVTDYLQFVDIVIANDLKAVEVKRKDAEKDTVVYVVVRCGHDKLV